MMTSVLMWVRSEMRARWRSWLGLAVLIGFGAGAVLACVAGARRTDTAYDRFLVEQRAYDAATFYAAWDPSFAVLDPDQLERLPSVAEAMRGFYFDADGDVGDAMAPADARWGDTFNGVRILEGRRPDPDAVDQAAVPISIADDLGAEVGGTITLRFNRMPRGDGQPEPAPMTFTVTALISAPGDFPPDAGSEAPFVHLTPAFHRANAESLMGFGVGFFRLHGGAAGVERFDSEIRSIAGGKIFFVMKQSDRTRVADEALGMVATAIWLLAAALALIVVLTSAQAIARQTFLESRALPVGRALGMTSGELFAIGLARAAFVGLVGGAIAVALAVAVSPLTPISLARMVEPNPGISIDVPVLALGMVAIWLGTMLLAAIPAWRAERSVQGEIRSVTRRSRLASTAWRLGFPAAVVAGVRLALERGRGLTAVPVRTTLGGAVLGIASLVMAATFGGSLGHLLETPRLYGVTWDLTVDAQTEGSRDREAAPRVAARVRRHPSVKDAAVVDPGIPLFVEGRAASAVSAAPEDAALVPTVLRGRVPRDGTEIVLGVRTFEAVGKAIGDQVNVSVAGLDKRVPFEIVGIAAMPGFDDTSQLGSGAYVHPDAVTRFIDDPPPVTMMHVQLRPGVDKEDAIEQLRGIEGAGDVRPAGLPAEVINLRRVRDLPTIMAAVLAILAAAAIAHALLSSVRRRARDLAILSALGFRSGQLRSVVAAQAVTLGAIALLLGIPAGIIVGRWLWTAVSGTLGVAAVPVAPLLSIAVLVPAAIVLVVLVSAIPGRTAARTRPATVLKVEA